MKSSISIVLGAGVTTKLVTRLSPRAVAPIGMLIAAGALFWLSGIELDTAYAYHIMLAIFALAFGFAMGFVPLTLTAVHGVRAQETGIASALLNASQQIGVAFGLAVLSSVSVTVTAGSLSDAFPALYKAREAANAGAVGQASEALIRGYSAGLLVGAVAIMAAGIIAAELISGAREKNSSSGGAIL